MEQINEFLTFKKVAFNLYNIDYYTSKDLKEKYLIALSKSNRTKPIIKKAASLLAKNKLRPVYQDPSLFQKVKMKIYKQIWAFENFLGFHDSTKHFCGIFMSDKLSPNSIDTIARITIHELIHMAAVENKNLDKVFKKELLEYYNEAFRRMFSLDDHKEKECSKITLEIIKFLYKDVELKETIDFKKYATLLNKFEEYSLLNDKLFKEKVNLVMLTVKLYNNNIEAFLNSINSLRGSVGPLYHAYQKIMSKVPPTICFQELLYPSEVIAIYSDQNNNKITKYINTIKS